MLLDYDNIINIESAWGNPQYYQVIIEKLLEKKGYKVDTYDRYLRSISFRIPSGEVLFTCHPWGGQNHITVFGEDGKKILISPKVIEEIKEATARLLIEIKSCKTSVLQMRERDLERRKMTEMF